MKFSQNFLLICSVVSACFFLPLQAHSQSRPQYDISEPKKAKSPKQLRDGQGALEISFRTQKQFTQTAIVYFVAVDDQGRDTDRVIRFERGAGVPLMGSNMIDEKPQVYRVPAGRYRPMAFTVACDQMPTAPDLVCGRAFGEGYPTGFYPRGEAVFEVTAGELTRGGDFIVEYVGPVPSLNVKLSDFDTPPRQWALRWRQGSGTASGFEALKSNIASVPQELHSRITCNARPEGVMLYIPFVC